MFCVSFWCHYSCFLQTSLVGEKVPTFKPELCVQVYYYILQSLEVSWTYPLLNTYIRIISMFNYFPDDEPLPYCDTSLYFVPLLISYGVYYLLTYSSGNVYFGFWICFVFPFHLAKFICAISYLWWWYSSTRFCLSKAVSF